MIRGYVEQPSPCAGERLRLRVATDAPQFRVDFYRWGAALTGHGRSEWLPGRDAPLHLPFSDWGEPGVGLDGEPLEAWPSYELGVPSSWSSGCYLAVLVEGDEKGRPLLASGPDPTSAAGAAASPDPTSAAAPRIGTAEVGGAWGGFDLPGSALFVVRPAPGSAPANLLYKVPLFTYHAYNLVAPQCYDPATRQGHWCLYNLPRPREVPRPFPESVNLHRPGGGAGGAPYDTFNFDPLDPTPRQTFGHWDARMVHWLEGEGYSLDYCTDFDLHTLGQPLLEPHRLLVSAGHDEYWSEEMRTAVEGFTTAGGNAAFFAGNVAWWQIVFDTPYSFSRPLQWHEVPGRPENLMTGVSFRNGGERDRDDHPTPVGYRVQHPDHWAYAGTGVRSGEVFGDRAEEYLVGYECDGAHFDRADLTAGRDVAPSGLDGTPGDFTILGVGDTRASGWAMGNGAATMGVFSPGGTVFTAGTTDWPRVLTQGSAVVARVTRNVLDHLGRVS